MEGRRLIYVLAAIFFLCLNAWAGEKTEELIGRATTFYGDLEFERALETLHHAIRQPGNNRSELIRIYHLSGLCHASLGHYQEAQDSFGRLLVLDPGFRLASDIAPRIGQPFQRLVQKNLPRVGARLIPPAYAQPSQSLIFAVEPTDDPMGMIEGIRIFFRRGEAGTYSSIYSPLKGGGKQAITISAATWEGKSSGERVYWYAVVEGAYQSRLEELGDAEHPSVLEVVKRAVDNLVATQESPSPWYKRWWIWAIIGGAAATATATAIVLSVQRTPSPPFDFSVDFSTSP